MSYSIYLWHWPVLAFTRYYIPALSTLHAMVALTAILLLAAASYHFIEQKARHTKLANNKQVALLFLAPLTLIAVSSLFVMRYSRQISDALGGHAYANAGASLRQQTAPAYEYAYNCQLSSFDPEVMRNATCVHGPSRAHAPKALLWGDSHAAHHIGVVGSLAETNGFQLRNASYSTCPPVFSKSADYGSGEYREGCTAFRDMMQAAIKEYPVVVMGGQWSVHRNHDGFDLDLHDTVKTLVSRGARVVILGEVSRFPDYDRGCEARNLRRQVVDCKALASRPDTGPTPANQALRAFAARTPGVYYMEVKDLLCTGGTCSPYLDGRPVYFDSNHLSMAGSWLIGHELVQSNAAIPAPLLPSSAKK